MAVNESHIVGASAPIGVGTCRRATWVVILLVIVVLALAGALIWSLLRVQHLDSVSTRDSVTIRSQATVISAFRTTDVQRGKAIQAARQYSVWLTSYDYRDLTSPTSDWSQVEAHSTSTFVDIFRQTTAGLASDITRYKAVATGTVVDVGVTTLTDTIATLDVFVDQSVTNTSQSGSATQPLRMELTLDYVNGQWLIYTLSSPK